MLSSRAAGELCDVLVEALGGELEPFHGGEIGKDRLTQFLGRHSILDRQHYGLDAVRTFRSENLRSQQPI